MPETIAPPAPPAAPAAVPAPVRHEEPTPGNIQLPPGFKMPDTSDNAPPAEEFFRRKEARERGEVPPAAPAPSSEPKPDPAVTPEPAPKVELPPESIAAKLLAARKPAEPVSAPKSETPPIASDNPEDKLEYTGKSEAQRGQFSQMKDIAKGLRKQLASEVQAREQRIAELQKKLEAAAQTPAVVDTKRLEQLESENKRLTDRLAVVDLRSLPAFQSQFTEPKETALANARTIAEAHEQTPDLNSLLNANKVEFRKQISAIATKLPPLDGAEFSQAMQQAYKLHQDESGALAQAKQLKEGLQQNTLIAQKKDFDATWSQVAGQTGEFLVKLDVPDKATDEQRQAIETYNQSISTLRTDAEKIAFAPQDNKGIALNAIKAAAYDRHIGVVLPRVLQEHQELAEKYQQVVAELTAIRGRNPNRDRNVPVGAGAPPTESQKKLADMDTASAARAVFGKRIV